MPFVVVLVIVAAILVFLFVAVAVEPGPAPADVATGYEAAWDRLDFSTLYDLSGDELRDGLSRSAFVAAKRAAYAGTADLARLAARITVESEARAGSSANVLTRVDLPEGTSVRNDIALDRRNGRWVVIGYRIRPDAEPSESSSV